jgi:Glycosyl hydrolases family 38 N-terminal domain/Glycosyl hydrolases family 38 C-terminal domain/Alpha mannosidase middle domain
MKLLRVISTYLLFVAKIGFAISVHVSASDEDHDDRVAIVVDDESTATKTTKTATTIVMEKIIHVDDIANTSEEDDDGDDLSWTVPSGLVKKYNAYPTNAGNTTETESTSRDPQRVLNVHIVPHTHDDVGWLKTIEQYYWGGNNTIQNVTVKDILDSVVESLTKHPHRTFTYVEQKFFTMWWNEQPSNIKTVVRSLVKNQQLTFVNGGWCMHDEAATHYMGMIDQTTLGHTFLKSEFDVVPKVGWQLDPFGHSASQASVMSYKMGFDALYFGRIDYQDLNLRQSLQECEGLWNASSSWVDSTVFWGLTGSYHGNYGRPDGYCFDIHCDPRQSVIDMNQTMLIGKVYDFIMALREQSDRTKGDNIMLTFGSDFSYQRAAMNYANMDMLFNSLIYFQESNIIDVPSVMGPRYDKINIFYSSPEYYTECKYNETKKTTTRTKTTSATGTDQSSFEQSSLRNKNQQRSTSLEDHHQSSSITTTTTTMRKPSSSSSGGGIEWTVKQDDFMPYSDCSHCFWTGYFTSRPALKRFERVTSSFLLAARQLDAMLDYTGHVDNVNCRTALHQLEDASGVAQHHDGVSGTSKQHVAYNYAERLQGGIDAVAGPCLVRKIRRLLLGNQASSEKKYLGDLTYCQLLNETKCDISMQMTANKDGVDDNDNGAETDIYVVVYNSLAATRSSVIHLPVATSDVLRVEDVTTETSTLISPIPSLWNNGDNKAPTTSPSEYVLTFEATELPPMGAKVFRIQKEPYGPSKFHDLTKRMDDNGILNISNNHIEIGLDITTGNIYRIGNQTVQNLTTWGYYTSFDADQHALHDGDHQNSGAYIFRPSFPGQKPNPIHAQSAKVIDTALGVEVHVEYSESWVQTTTRILKDKPYVEIEYQVGPIPIDDGLGKEIIVKYNTGVQNDGTFYSDTNGREFVRRQRNYRPTWNMAVYEPVAGNYYPINAAAYMDDGVNSFSVVTDRTQGGGSITDGTFEIMVHRRTVKDDARGVGEPINETDVGMTPYHPWGNATRLGKGIVIKGTHRVFVGSDDSNNYRGGASMARSAMDDTFADPIVFVASATSSLKIPFQKTSFTGLSKELPENVMVITKRQLYSNNSASSKTVSYLVRLGHQYGLDEDPTLSKPVEVDLRSLFPSQAVTHVTELTLSGSGMGTIETMLLR